MSHSSHEPPPPHDEAAQPQRQVLQYDSTPPATVPVVVSLLLGLASLASVLMVLAAPDPENRIVMGGLVGIATGVAAIVVADRSVWRLGERLSRRRARLLAAGRVLGILGIAASLVMFLIVARTPLSRSPETANRIKCGMNLRQIGRALQTYHAAHGVPPSDIVVLLADAGLPPDVLHCPSAPAPASGEALVYGVNVSYVIIVDAASLTNHADVIVAVESPANHNGEGGTILYADGSVQWMNADGMAQIVAALQAAGRWPFHIDPRPFLAGRKPAGAPTRSRAGAGGATDSTEATD